MYVPLIKKVECNARILKILMDWIHQIWLKDSHLQPPTHGHAGIKQGVRIHPAMIHEVDLIGVVTQKFLALSKGWSRVDDDKEIHIRYDWVLKTTTRVVWHSTGTTKL